MIRPVKTNFLLPLAVLLAGMMVLLPLFGIAQAPVPNPSAAPAHESKADAQGLEGNYVLTLSSPADKRNGPELGVVLALFASDRNRDPAEIQTSFDVTNSAQPHLHFRGSLQPQKDGRYLLNYTLECANDSASTGLMLRPGEPVQMIKSGDLYFNLRLERYNPSTPR